MCDDLVIGLTAPIGVDLDLVTDTIKNKLKKFGYKDEDIKTLKMSDLILKILQKKSKNPIIFENYKELINEGNLIREAFGKKSILSLFAINEIQKLRESNNSSQKEKPKKVYIIRQFKKPEEIKVFQYTYGKSFFSLGIISDENTRSKALINKIAQTPNRNKGNREEVISSKAQAFELFDLDDQAGKSTDKNNKYFQNISKTLDLADFFIDYKQNITHLDFQIKRFLEVIFKRPYRAPTKDEYCMSVAFSSALRSMDLGQQVGCCIASKNGEIISTGFNEVPVKTGGVDWESQEIDERDHAQDEYAMNSIRNEYVQKILSDIPHSTADCNCKTNIKEALNTTFGSLIEFGRSTHAEMVALLEAARLGKSVSGAILYSTTYPCHLCTVNILAAGIEKIVYLKHYEKSRASRMFPYIHDEKKFQPYLGFSARIYSRIYSQFFDDGLKNPTTDKRINWNPLENKRDRSDKNQIFFNEKIVSCFLSKLIEKIKLNPKKPKINLKWMNRKNCTDYKNIDPDLFD
jgi:cytidine deaminase